MVHTTIKYKTAEEVKESKMRECEQTSKGRIAELTPKTMVMMVSRSHAELLLVVPFGVIRVIENSSEEVEEGAIDNARRECTFILTTPYNQ